MSYDNPIRITTEVLASAISTNGVKRKIAGPAGLTGRIESVVALVTTATTADATIISVGTSGDPDAYTTLSVPILSADGIANVTVGGVTDAIPADSIVEISSDGGSTAGAADIVVVTAWY